MAPTSLQAADQIRKQVYDRFYWDSRVEYSNINVEVNENKVILKGSVPSHTARKFAEINAGSIPGVRAVSNQLVIKFAGNVLIPSDREVETKVRDVIRWNTNLDASRIDVRVNGGHATLAGVVHSYYQKFRAQELAADVVGVTRIDNRLTVVPAVSPADEEIAEKTIAALKDRLSADADHLTVMVRGGIVTLTGTVPDRLALAAAENVAGHIRGVVDLHNHLQVDAAGGNR